RDRRWDARSLGPWRAARPGRASRRHSCRPDPRAQRRERGSFGERLSRRRIPVRRVSARDARGAAQGARRADGGLPIVFYEAPHRVLETLEDLAGHFGAGREIVIGRELTKKFEEIAR